MTETQMLKRTTHVIVVALACTTAAFAQSGSTPPPQPMSKDAKEGTVVVTGCVTQGTTPDSFELNNASMPDPVSKDAPAPPDETKATKPTTAMSYLLSGDDTLKAHVGHKIAVTGTVDRMGNMSGEKTPREKTTGEKTPPATSGTTGGAHGRKGGTLKVQSVKMISTTCP